MKVLTASQMREVDRITIEQLGVPGLVLMENAGRNVVRFLEDKFPSLDRERIAILCGKGNNGGDGFVIARHLKMRRIQPRVFLLAAPDSLKGDARANYEMLLKGACEPTVVLNFNEWVNIKPELLRSTLLIDAILGTGLDGPVKGFYEQVIRDLNSSFSHIPMVAVDMPSGMPSDTGATLGESLRARHTITFTAPKWSHIFPPNCERVGELLITPIGTPASAYEADASIFLNLLTKDIVAPITAERPEDSNKGMYGHVLVVAGSKGKSGAAALSGLAALRAGAGLVTVATASSVWPIVAAASPTLMTEPLAESDTGAISLGAFDYGRFESIAKGKSVLAIGPGLSTHPSTVEFIRRVVRESSGIPVVIDADGLNAFAGAPDLLRGEGRKLILTPHPGEMARLTGLGTKEIQANRVEVARQYAMRQKVYLVLKGYRTLIAEPGGQVYVNPTGNPGMAKGGTGDVLTGIIAGLLAQHPGEPVENVVSAAIYWHGAAGDLAAAEKGELSMLATDLIEAMPDALRAQTTKTTFTEQRAGGC